jgi:hypothetical protein
MQWVIHSAAAVLVDDSAVAIVGFHHRVDDSVRRPKDPQQWPDAENQCVAN